MLRTCTARLSAGILEPRKSSLFMDSVLATASRISLSRFLLGWLLSWIVPAMVSTGLVGTLNNVRIAGVSHWVFQISLLSFPASWGVA